MDQFYLTHPVAAVARAIETLCLYRSNSHSLPVKTACFFTNRILGVTAFPLALTAELFLKRLPRLAMAPISFRADPVLGPAKWESRLDKVKKFALGILFTPLNLYNPSALSGFFLKNPPSPQEIRPFGVEEIYGKKVDQIYYPSTVEEVQNLVLKAKQEKKQISVIGAGMSQGPQTIPTESQGIAINMKFLNQISFGGDGTTVTAQSGAVWEKIQAEADLRGKSVIVKQASDIFSVGGSIGINCHGWAHDWGSIASTVESIDIIDAEGRLRTLTPQDEEFGCFFGTLGYFGIVVNAKLKLAENEYLFERTTVVPLDQFTEEYEQNIKGKDIPLFGGRLILDPLDGSPLREVYMVRYEKDPIHSLEKPLPSFAKESEKGTRIERMALQAIGLLPLKYEKSLISSFWHREATRMLKGGKIARNEALHPPIKAFNMLRHSRVHTQWLQEYFIKKENLPNFLRFLGSELKANDVRLINATIRPTPKDSISVLPYAEQDRYAVVLSFSQTKTDKEIAITKSWMRRVHDYVISSGDRYYQAYMPFATQADFEKAYGQETVARLRSLKQKYDPEHRFGNGHTAKYFDVQPQSPQSEEI